MNRRSIIGLFAILLITSSSSASIWFASAFVETQQSSNPSLNQIEDYHIQESITAPNTINMSQLASYDYYESVRADRNFKWKITELEKTDDFHISEGDKHLKKGDNIILRLGGNPWLQRTEPDAWGQLYVNDVMARYPTVEATGRAIYKYLQPIGLSLIEEYLGETYNYTDMGNEGYFEYLENSPYVDNTGWTFDEELAYYENTMITEINNVTEISLIFDKTIGLLNEMYYSASFTNLINGTTTFSGVNLTMVRLHGWGLPYYITTWVVWIPIILVLIGLIVAIRMQAFQRLKLYLEARKLAKRD